MDTSFLPCNSFTSPARDQEIENQSRYVVCIHYSFIAQLRGKMGINNSTEARRFPKGWVCQV